MWLSHHSRPGVGTHAACQRFSCDPPRSSHILMLFGEREYIRLGVLGPLHVGLPSHLIKFPVTQGKTPSLQTSFYSRFNLRRI